MRQRVCHVLVNCIHFWVSHIIHGREEEVKKVLEGQMGLGALSLLLVSEICKNHVAVRPVPLCFRIYLLETCLVAHDSMANKSSSVDTSSSFCVLIKKSSKDLTPNLPRNLSSPLQFCNNTQQTSSINLIKKASTVNLEECERECLTLVGLLVEHAPVKVLELASQHAFPVAADAVLDLVHQDPSGDGLHKVAQSRQSKMHHDNI